MVHKRRSRRNYGYLCSSSYDDSMAADVKSRKRWSPTHDRWMVDGNIQWYIKRDQVIAQTAVITFPFIQMVQMPHGGAVPNLRFVDTLLSCDLDTAPDYKFQNPNAVSTVCTVHSDLSGVPLSKFVLKKNSDGRKYYKVPFDMTMTIVDEVIKFELKYQGESYGVVTTRFDEQ